LILLCAGSLWLWFRHIESTLPYPHHIDEGFVSGPAAQMLVTGTLHPDSFNYPSLPKYLAAVGIAGGFLRSAARREIQDVRRLGSVSYPHYSTPRAVQGARQLFALLSVVTLAATGWAAYLASLTPATIFLAPLLLAASPLFFNHSWRYLNVDIVGACFAVLTLVACLQGTREPSTYRSAIVPGLFAGLAAGSKYTLALVVVPVLLGIGLYFNAGRRIAACVAAIAAMAAAFLIVVPYSLLDISSFLNGIASEAYHYAGGHAGYEAEPGWPQLYYYAGHFATEFGAAGAILAVLGAFVFWVADWRRALVLFSFPLALLWLLASQRVHFARNVLSLHPIVAMFLACGLISVHGWALRLAARREWTSRRLGRPLSIMVGLLLVAAAVPFAHVADQFRDRTDSRKLALTWIQERLPPEWSIVVPSQLGVDTDTLIKATGRRVMVVDLQSARDSSALHQLLRGISQPAVIMAPRWGADPRFPGRDVAPVLNEVTRHWRIVKTFGANPVLVNYSQPVPSGNPAFVIAILD
jgi:hypothetical protein